MIYDRLENFPQYLKLAPEVWQKIIDFFDRCGAGIEPGHYQIDGEKLYANVQNYASHPRNDEQLEFHKNYIDIQLLLAGTETIFYAPLDGTKVVDAYDKSKDYGMNTVPAAALPLALEVGNFAIFFPDEGHHPGVGDGSPVIKVVVKIAAELLD